MLFSDIIGQGSVKQHLLKSVKDGKISHAYLFAGPEGCGSLPLAIAFARFINCLNPAINDACNVCSSCIKISKLIHPDLHFVFPVIKKGGSVPVSDDYISEWRTFILANNYFSSGQWFGNIADEKKSGLIYSEESLAIIRKLNLRNFEGKFKIMIIWLPEKMNDTGSNKLLKVLEEPPGNTVFLLVSESPELLLATIRSRAQQINIPPVKTAVLSSELQKRFGINPNQADSIARLSNGNMVKAIDSLDSAIDKSGFFSLFTRLMRAAYGRKIFDIVDWVDEVSPLSRDSIRNFLTYSIGLLRDSYLYNFQQPELVVLGSIEEDFVSKFSPFLNFDNLSNMVEEMELACAHIEQNGNSKIVLFDMALKMVIMFKG